MEEGESIEFTIYYGQPLCSGIGGCKFDSLIIRRTELIMDTNILEFKLHRGVFHWHKVGSAKLSTTARTRFERNEHLYQNQEAPKVVIVVCPLSAPLLLPFSSASQF